MSFYDQTRESIQKWVEPADAKEIGDLLESIFTSFRASSGWPEKQIAFWDILGNESMTKPSQAISSVVGGWYHVRADYDCGIQGIRPLSINVYIRGNRKGEHMASIGSTLLELKQPGAVAAGASAIGTAITAGFAQAELPRRDTHNPFPI